MVNFVINSQNSLLQLIGALRSGTTFTLTSLAIDAQSAFLSQNNCINDWGPLLSALTLPSSSQHLRSLDVCNISPDTAALVVPHIAKLVSRLTHIEAFSLRRCPLGVKTAQFVGECLSGHPWLKRVVVEQCDLRSEGALLFAKSLLKPGAALSASPLELIDLGHNAIRVSACKDIADLVKSLVVASSTTNDNQSSTSGFFANLKRIEFRGNSCVLTQEDLQDQDLLKRIFASRKNQEDLDLVKKNLIVRGKTHSSVPATLLHQLPVGDNLKFMTSAEKQTGFVFPTLDYLSNQVRQELLSGSPVQ